MPGEDAYTELEPLTEVGKWAMKFYGVWNLFSGLFGDQSPAATQQALETVEEQVLSAVNDLGHRIDHQIERVIVSEMEIANANIQGYLGVVRDNLWYSTITTGTTRDLHLQSAVDHASYATNNLVGLQQVLEDSARNITAATNPLFMATTCATLPLWIKTNLICSQGTFFTDRSQVDILWQLVAQLESMINSVQENVELAHKHESGSHEGRWTDPHGNDITVRVPYWRHRIIDVAPTLVLEGHSKAAEWVWEYGPYSADLAGGPFLNGPTARARALVHRNLGIQQELEALGVPSFEAICDSMREYASAL
jgi:hypothetical protein